MFAAAFALAAQTASPGPAPRGCDADAQMPQLVYPDGSYGARSYGVDDQSLYAIVAVTVEADGTVKKTVIVRSSGDRQFDLMSIRTARLSKYKAKLLNCEPVEGTARFISSQGTRKSQLPFVSPSPTPYCQPNAKHSVR